MYIDWIIKISAQWPLYTAIHSLLCHEDFYSVYNAYLEV